MKAEILEIITQHKSNHISSEQAVSELFDLIEPHCNHSWMNAGMSTQGKS